MAPSIVRAQAPRTIGKQSCIPLRRCIGSCEAGVEKWTRSGALTGPITRPLTLEIAAG